MKIYPLSYVTVHMQDGLDGLDSPKNLSHNCLHNLRFKEKKKLRFQYEIMNLKTYTWKCRIDYLKLENL